MTAAIKASGKIKDKARKYAAHMLEASPDDIEIVGAEYRVKGSPDRKKSLQEIAFALDLAFDAPEGMEPYLDETAYHDTPNCTWPFGTHIAVVEIDEETGKVDLVRYIAVDDVGKKINPMIVDGQLHGGIAQGVGQALWEQAIYGEDGQLLTGSMLDYALPRAAWLPNLELDETVTPSPVNPIGVKGVGEAGAIASTAAVANAVNDALSGARHQAPRHAVHRPDRVAGAAVREGRPGMNPAAFEYTRASSLADAVAAVGGGAKVIAGGQSLLPLLKLRLAAADKLVDIGRLDELKGYRPQADGGVEIGALTTYAEWQAATTFPGVAEAIDHIADVQVRNRGTIGGSVAHADPASDFPAIALAFEGSAVLRGPARRAGRPARRLLRGPVPDPDPARRDPRRDPPRAGPTGRRRSPTRSSPSLRPATRSSASPPSS